MNHIFGFCEDYDKIVYGFTHTLTLVRKSDNDAIFRTGTTDPGKIQLNSISWHIPHVLPSDIPKMSLYKIIEEKSKLTVGFRNRDCNSINIPQTVRKFNWKLGVKSSPETPRYIIVGFQIGETENQERNPCIFDHVNVTKICVMLNSIQYPEKANVVSFPQHRFDTVYEDAASFRSKFYHMDKLVSNPNITPSDFKTLYPIFVFDVSKQSEKIKHAFSDIEVRAEFSENVPANTNAYTVIISDSILYFRSDGNKLAVVQ